jgi:hypothetical protein
MHSVRRAIGHDADMATAIVQQRLRAIFRRKLTGASAAGDYLMRAGNGRQLWATICEIEPGLYQTIYSNTGSAAEEGKLPLYQTGECPSDAKRRIEHSVRALGYDAITWIEARAADVVLPRIGSEASGARKRQPPPYAMRF